jgi:hypothetical protein
MRTVAVITQGMVQVLARLAQPPPGLESCPADECACVLGMTGVGVTVGTVDVGALVWRSDEVSVALDELQFTVGQGPCVDALDGIPVMESDLTNGAHTRWPGFTPAALDLGVRAVFALPLTVGTMRLGVLELHRDTPGPLDGEALADAWAFAEATTAALAEVPVAGPAVWPGTELVPRRAVIHQATGMISVQLGVDAGEALVRLRAYAYGHGRPASWVAREVVDRRLRFGPSQR